MTEKKKQPAEEKAYRSLVEEAGRLMESGDLEGTLAAARKGHELGLALSEPTATAQLLFCLNETGDFAGALAASDSWWAASGKYHEAILSNALCAMLASKPVDSTAGMELLAKLKLDSAGAWGKILEDFEFSPAQMGLVFNAALIMAHGGHKNTGQDILALTLSRMIHFIDTITGGARDLLEDEAMNLAVILQLIMESPEFSDLDQSEDFQELADIIEGCLE
jgi:hypothetical protein